MKKFLWIGLIFCNLLTYSYDLESLDKVDAEYQELLQKENEKIEEFKAEKTKLENELSSLKERQIGKENVFEKLRKDSEIRWHRDEYKALLKKYETYYQKLEKAISEKEQKISELENLLNILSQ